MIVGRPVPGAGFPLGGESTGPRTGIPGRAGAEQTAKAGTESRGSGAEVA